MHPASIRLHTSAPPGQPDRRHRLPWWRGVMVLGVLALLGQRPLAAQAPLVLLSDSGSGRATAYAKTNKIVTAQGRTHVAWLDSTDDGFAVRIRTHDSAADQWSETYTLGPAWDNHGGPALAIDGAGFLHVVYGPHHGPLSYRRSSHPHDASSWEPEIRFGNNLTYPSLMVAADHSLIVVARQSAAGPWSVVSHRKPPHGDWSQATELIRAPAKGYSQFHVSLAWGPQHQTLHLAGRAYGGNPAWGYLVGYMCSPDGGTTWQTSQGGRIRLPAAPTDLDVIYRTPKDLRRAHASGSAVAGGSVAVDSANRPVVLYHRLGTAAALPHRSILARPAPDGGWDQLELNPLLQAAPEGASLSTPGGLCIDASGAWNLALTLTPQPTSAGDPFGHPTTEVLWARSTDQGATFQSQIISPVDPATAHWLPNLERPTGFNDVERPAVIFTAGPKGAGLKDRLHNRVYWFLPPVSRHAESPAIPKNG